MAHPEETKEKIFEKGGVDTQFNLKVMAGNVYANCDDLALFFINQKETFAKQEQEYDCDLGDLKEFCNQMASIFINLKARNR